VLDPKMKIMSLVCNEWEEEHAYLGYRYKRRATEQALIFWIPVNIKQTNQTLPSIIYLQTHHGKRERAMD